MIKQPFMHPKNCIVSCRDVNGTEHSVTVTAESLYDEVAQGLRAFRFDEWTTQVKLTDVVTIKVMKEPPIEHRVRVRAFESWLESTNKSPREVIQKARIRERLEK